MSHTEFSTNNNLERPTTEYQKLRQLAVKRTLHLVVQAILREKICEINWNNTQQGLIATLSARNGEIVVSVVKQYTLQQIEIAGDIYYRTSSSEKKIGHPIELLNLLNINLDQKSIVAEIDNSIDNYALALAGACIRKNNIVTSKDTITYLINEKREDSRFSPLVFAEQWVIEGHTIHPCSKTRLGVSNDELMEYSPEWGGKPKVVPVAVRKDYVRLNSIDTKSMTDILLHEYPHIKEAAFKQLPTGGLDLYELIPIHPWQLTHTLETYYKAEMDQDIIIPLVNAEIETFALLSFRSLSPANGPTFHHIKTAVDIQMTSAKRGVSPASVINGPILTEILKNIHRTDLRVSKTLYFLEERAGGYFQPAKIDNSSFLSKNLSALVRENPEEKLNEEEIAVPAAFLISNSPITGKLILSELIEKLKSDFGDDTEKAATHYIHTYANGLLPGLLTLIIKYGISLESHLQNAIVVLKNGIPERFLLRDLGGIRIKGERLTEIFDIQSIDDSTNLLTDNEKDLFTMFSHALLNNHLGEMIHFLSKDLDISEQELWYTVKNVIMTTLEQLKEDGEKLIAIQEFEKLLYSSSIPMKALLKMRLSEQFLENSYTSVPNPFLTKEQGGN